MTRLTDSCHRAIDYLRISVTDRCNLRCIYCTPVNGVHWLSRSEVLSYEEITTIARIAAGLGITKVRLTGGEPLVRSWLSKLIANLMRISTIEDISLTTNGIMLGRYAQELKRAGLKRVNISLDTLNPEKFKRITRYDKLQDVLRGIETAKAVGLDPVKINVVAMRGVNDDEILDFGRLSIDSGWHVRFIELMPFTSETCSDAYLGGNKDNLQNMFIPVDEIKEKLSKLGPLTEPESFIRGNGPAKYFRLPGATGTIGFIGAVSNHFCDNCNRLRLTSDGRLRLCLFSDDEIDLRALLRSGAPPDKLREAIVEAVKIKPKQHQLAHGGVSQKRFMSQVGG